MSLGGSDALLSVIKWPRIPAQHLEYVGRQIPVSDIAAAIKKALAKDADLELTSSHG